MGFWAFGGRTARVGVACGSELKAAGVAWALEQATQPSIVPCLMYISAVVLESCCCCFY